MNPKLGFKMQFFPKNKSGVSGAEKVLGGSPKWQNELKREILRVAHTHTTLQCECPLPPGLIPFQNFLVVWNALVQVTDLDIT